jgi:hypothetical protein
MATDLTVEVLTGQKSELVLSWLRVVRVREGRSRGRKVDCYKKMLNIVLLPSSIGGTTSLPETCQVAERATRGTANVRAVSLSKSLEHLPTFSADHVGTLSVGPIQITSSC